MSTFPDGWICTKCWKANRDGDIRCYRCKSMNSALEASGLLDETRQARTSVIGPTLRRWRASVTTGGRAIVALLARWGRGLAAAWWSALRRAGVLLVLAIGFLRAGVVTITRAMVACARWSVRIANGFARASVAAATIAGARLTAAATGLAGTLGHAGSGLRRLIRTGHT